MRRHIVSELAKLASELATAGHTPNSTNSDPSAPKHFCPHNQTKADTTSTVTRSEVPYIKNITFPLYVHSATYSRPSPSRIQNRSSSKTNGWRKGNQYVADIADATGCSRSSWTNSSTSSSRAYFTTFNFMLPQPRQRTRTRHSGPNAGMCRKQGIFNQPRVFLVAYGADLCLRLSSIFEKPTSYLHTGSQILHLRTSRSGILCLLESFYDDWIFAHCDFGVFGENSIFGYVLATFSAILDHYGNPNPKPRPLKLSADVAQTLHRRENPFAQPTSVRRT